MKLTEIKKCAKCGSINIEADEAMVLCTDCGFNTAVQYVNLSDNFRETDSPTEFDEFMRHMPMVVSANTVFDGNYYWLPIVMNFYPEFMIYPVQKKDEALQWCYTPYIKKNVVLDENGKAMDDYAPSTVLDLQSEQHYSSFKELYNRIKD